MRIQRNALDPGKFNPAVELPFQLRVDDLRATVQDVYDFFYDVNMGLVAKGLERLGQGHVSVDDFRRNERGELGTRTATLHAEGIAKLRRSGVYLA